MIQRIQSVYLLLAGIIPAFTFCTPIITFSNGSSLMSYAITGTEEHFISCPWGVLAFTVLSILTALFTIFNYKNRPRQIRLCNLLLIFILLLYVSILAYSYAFENRHNVSMSYSIGLLLPLISYVSGWLARRAIRKDEALVRAAERFR